jgi:hypothetical protein
MSAALGRDVCKPPAVGWTGGLQRADTCGGCRASGRLGVWPPEDWGDTCCDPVLIPPSDENGVRGAVMEMIGRCDRRLEGMTRRLSRASSGRRRASSLAGSRVHEAGVCSRTWGGP